MDEELNALVEAQEQLRAMKQSCVEFEQKLNGRVAEYLEKNLAIKRDDTFSVIDLVAKVKGK